MELLQRLRNLVSFLLDLSYSLVVSALLYCTSWRSSPEQAASLSSYHDLNASETPGAPVSAQEDSAVDLGDDLESGLLSPPLICITPTMRSPLQHDPGLSFSSPSSPTLAGSPNLPYTPTLTPSVLSPYPLQGCGMSLSESAQGILSGQSWATTPKAKLQDSDAKDSGLAIFGAGHSYSHIDAPHEVDLTTLSCLDETIPHPWPTFPIRALDESESQLDSSPPSSVQAAGRSLCDCGHSYEGTCSRDSHRTGISPAETPRVAENPEASPTEDDAQQIPPPATKRRRPSGIRFSSKIHLALNIPGTPAPPLPYHLSFNQTSYGASASVVVQAPLLEPIECVVAEVVETTAISSFDSTASFLSVPNGSNSLQAGDDEDDPRLPTSLSAPEPHYFEFYYEHYCPEPILPTLLKTSGSLEEVREMATEESRCPVNDASKAVIQRASVAPCWVNAFTESEMGSPSFFVFPTLSNAKHGSIELIPEEETDPYSGIENSNAEIRGSTGKDLAASESAFTSGSDADTEGSLILDTTLVQARRASLSKPVFLLRAPGTRESIVVSRTTVEEFLAAKSVSFLVPGRPRSGTNDTQSSTSTGSAKLGGLLKSGVESMSDIPASSRTSLEMGEEVVENHEQRVSSEDEAEVGWLSWPPLPIVNDPPPSYRVLAPGLELSRTLALFNNNHRKPYVQAASASYQQAPPPPRTTSLTRQPTLQSNIRQAIISHIHDFLPAKLPEYHHRRDHGTTDPSVSFLRTSQSLIVQMDNNTISGDAPRPPELTFSESRYPRFGGSSDVGLDMDVLSLANSAISAAARKRARDGNGGGSGWNGKERRRAITMTTALMTTKMTAKSEEQEQHRASSRKTKTKTIGGSGSPGSAGVIRPFADSAL